MDSIANILMIAGVFSAAFYCRTLSVRVQKLKDLDKGIGATIAALSQQVVGMSNALESTKALSGATTSSLSHSTARAEIAAGRLELLLAKVHENKTRVQPTASHSKVNANEKYVVPMQLRDHQRLPDAELTPRIEMQRAYAKIQSPLAETNELVLALRQALFGKESIAGGK